MSWIWPSRASYAEISVEGNAVETTISSADAYVQVTVFDTDDLSSNMTPDHTNDHITIDEAGVYFVVATASVFSGTGSAAIFSFEIKSNNGTVAHTNIHSDRQLSGGGGDAGSVTMAGITAFAVNDTVEFWILNQTNTVNLVIEDASLSVVRLK